MGWSISQRINKNGKKQYKIWTSISDAWTTDWIDRDQVIRELADRSEFEYKKNVIEYYYRFPHNFGDHDAKQMKLINDEEAFKNWQEWNKKVLDSFENKTYFSVIEEEFERIKKELNL